MALGWVRVAQAQAESAAPAHHQAQRPEDHAGAQHATGKAEHERHGEHGCVQHDEPQGDRLPVLVAAFVATGVILRHLLLFCKYQFK